MTSKYRKEIESVRTNYFEPEEASIVVLVFTPE